MDEKIKKINPGEGYRLLKPGARIQTGDEYYHELSDTWGTTGDAGKRIPKDTFLTYRRKLKTPAKRRSPGRGYAWVKQGDTVLVGDEIHTDDWGWAPVSVSIGWIVPHDYDYRRKIGKPKPADMTKPAKPAKPAKPEHAKPRWDVNIGNAYHWSRVTELKCSVTGNFIKVQFLTAGGDYVNVTTAATVVTTERAV